MASDKKRKIEIVEYGPQYRRLVRDCVYETGFGGESAERYFEDRELFADFLTNYYVDHEPGSAFIALVDGQPAGYLLGCIDTRKCNGVTRRKVFPPIVKKLLTGGYHVGPGVRLNMLRAFQAAIRGEHVTPPLDVYPAHLHVDMLKEGRRCGAGSALMARYLDFLRDNGVGGVHLGTSSFHVEALPFYEKLGFHRYRIIRLTSSFFEHVVQKDFYELCYVKRL